MVIMLLFLGTANLGRHLFRLRCFPPPSSRHRWEHQRQKIDTAVKGTQSSPIAPSRGPRRPCLFLRESYLPRQHSPKVLSLQHLSLGCNKPQRRPIERRTAAIEHGESLPFQSPQRPRFIYCRAHVRAPGHRRRHRRRPPWSRRASLTSLAERSSSASSRDSDGEERR